MNNIANNPLDSVEEPGPDIRAENAWKYIWLYPRQVFLSALKNFPGKYVVLIFAITGISSDYITLRFSETFSSSWILNLVFVIAGAMIFSYFICQLFSWLLSEAGKIFGGDASFREMRTILAWAMIPTVAASILSAGDIFVLVQNAVNQDVIIKSSLVATLLTVLSTVQFALGIWTVVLLIIGIKTVQNFSFFKALLNMILPFLVLLCIFILFIFIS